MRTPLNPTGYVSRISRSRLRAQIIAVFSAAALSACSAIGDEQADITGDSVDEINWGQQRTAELERQIAELKARNAELEREIEALRQPQNADGEEMASAGKSAADGSLAPAIKPETVIAAADAQAALADSPEKPVQDSPRLVPPTFASAEEPLFENEAQGSLQMSSVLYGVHLASYRTEEDARAGWRKLQRDNPDELGLLEPRTEWVTIEGRGDFIRLIGGGFSSRAKAEALCETLKTKGLFCTVSGFGGDRLSLADAPAR